MMASKGGQTTLKRIAANKARKLERKDLTWTIKTMPGPHSDATAVPLGFVIRDLLKLASNLKEAKILLNAGKIKVNGIVRKNFKFPVGLFDVVQIDEAKKAFRLVFEKHGRLEAREIKFAAKQFTVCKIKGKKMLEKGKVQLVASDGRNFIASEKDALAKAKPGDSVLVEFPAKAEKVFELKKGNTVFVVSGKHVGDIAKIIGVSASTMSRPKLVTLKAEEKYDTVAENVLVIGEEKSAIEF